MSLSFVDGSRAGRERSSSTDAQRVSAPLRGERLPEDFGYLRALRLPAREVPPSPRSSEWRPEPMTCRRRPPPPEVDSSCATPATGSANWSRSTTPG